MRIVSLIASATEIACALGLRSQLVGRSHECDFPADVGELPQCSRPRFPDGASGAIDQEVRALVERGLSVYDVDAQLLQQLAPDVILTQDQCEVCAVSLQDVEAALACCLPGVKVVSLKPFSLDDVLEDVKKVAAACAVDERGQELCQQLRQRLAQLTIKSWVPQRVVCLEWLEPLMACGYWAPQLVELAGGADLLGRAGGHAPWISLEQLEAADPDTIIAFPCGFGLERSERELRALEPRWSGLRAFREGRFFVADGNAYFNRPGPRLVDSLEIITQILWGEPDGVRAKRYS